MAKLVACVGRRGGKSKAMATLVAYIAGRCVHSDVLEPGEVGTALCVALNAPARRLTARARTLRLTEADPIRNSLPPIPIMRRHF